MLAGADAPERAWRSAEDLESFDCGHHFNSCTKPRCRADAVSIIPSMTDTIRELDVVALTVDVPEKRLRRGQVGTVVMVYSASEFEVEFVDSQGHTYALTTLNAAQLLPLRWEPVAAA